MKFRFEVTFLVPDPDENAHAGDSFSGQYVTTYKVSSALELFDKVMACRGWKAGVKAGKIIRFYLINFPVNLRIYPDDCFSVGPDEGLRPHVPDPERLEQYCVAAWEKVSGELAGDEVYDFDAPATNQKLINVRRAIASNLNRPVTLGTDLNG